MSLTGIPWWTLELHAPGLAFTVAIHIRESSLAEDVFVSSALSSIGFAPPRYARSRRGDSQLRWRASKCGE